MSQLLDSLRRTRQPQRAEVPRAGRGDAVLATLGYAPARRVGGSSPVLRVVGVILVLAAIWICWRLYYGPGSEMESRRGLSRTPPSMELSPTTVRPVRAVKPPAASPAPTRW